MAVIILTITLCILAAIGCIEDYIDNTGGWTHDE